jgi:hypothetical protein
MNNGPVLHGSMLIGASGISYEINEGVRFFGVSPIYSNMTISIVGIRFQTTLKSI